MFQMRGDWSMALEGQGCGFIDSLNCMTHFPLVSSCRLLLCKGCSLSYTVSLAFCSFSSKVVLCTAMRPQASILIVKRSRHWAGGEDIRNHNTSALLKASSIDQRFIVFRFLHFHTVWKKPDGQQEPTLIRSCTDKTRQQEGNRVPPVNLNCIRKYSTVQRNV